MGASPDSVSSLRPSSGLGCDVGAINVSAWAASRTPTPVGGNVATTGRVAARRTLPRSSRDAGARYTLSYTFLAPKMLGRTPLRSTHLVTDGDVFPCQSHNE